MTLTFDDQPFGEGHDLKTERVVLLNETLEKEKEGNERATTRLQLQPGREKDAAQPWQLVAHPPCLLRSKVLLQQRQQQRHGCNLRTQISSLKQI